MTTAHIFPRVLLSLAIVLLTTPVAIALAETAPPKQVASVEGITEYQLDNGLRVLLYPDASRPTVTVNMVVLVGSRHEGYGETGMAHLLEHMNFKGTEEHPNIPKVLQDHGAQFNATTSDDRTNYFETVPASDENLDYFLRLEADRLVNSFIRKSDLDSEMTVVRNEFERGENSPISVLMERISEAAYEFHNYGKPTIGNRSDIERVPIDNLQAFYHKYYRPDNVVLVIAGQFEPAKALELVQKYFGAIPRPHAEARRHLHRRAGAGRRTDRHAAPRGRCRRSGRGLSHSRQFARRFRGAAGVGEHPQLAALRPALQSAGRNQKSHQCLRQRPQPARSRFVSGDGRSARPQHAHQRARRYDIAGRIDRQAGRDR